MKTCRPKLERRARGILEGWLAWLSLSVLCCAKPSDGQPSGGRARATAASSIAPRSASTAPSPRSQVESLSRLELSAYTATLAADDRDIYVLTSHAAYRFGEGEAASHWVVELGDTPALASASFVFWLGGELRRVPKGGGPVEILARVPRAPRRLLASGEHLLWEEPERSTSALRTLDGSAPRTVYVATGTIEALALMDDQAYFVERDQQRWRLGTVALGGGAARFTERRDSRAPALLATAGDVFYYDGPSSTVRRVRSDLSGEEVIARDVICSPLAVAERVYCAQLSLLFDLAREGGGARAMAMKRPGKITALVTTRTRLAWLLDVGENRAELEVLPR